MTDMGRIPAVTVLTLSRFGKGHPFGGRLPPPKNNFLRKDPNAGGCPNPLFSILIPYEREPKGLSH